MTMYESVCYSVVSDAWQPHRLQTARLLCAWDSPGKNRLTESPVCVSCIAGGLFTTLPGNPIIYVMHIILNIKYMCILTRIIGDSASSTFPDSIILEAKTVPIFFFFSRKVRTGKGSESFHLPSSYLCLTLTFRCFVFDLASYRPNEVCFPLSFFGGVGVIALGFRVGPAVQWSESAACVHISPSSWASLPGPPRSSQSTELSSLRCPAGSH